MNNENGAAREVVDKLFEDATNDVFSPVGLVMESITVDGDLCEKRAEGDSILSVLSASGEGIKILSTINASMIALEALFPHSDSPSEEDLRDWCGELNNQIVGAAKNHLLAYGCKVLMGLPTMVRGENLANLSAENAFVTKRTYVASGHEIITYISTIIHPNFIMLDEPDESLTGLTAGGELDFF